MTIKSTNQLFLIFILIVATRNLNLKIRNSVQIKQNKKIVSKGPRVRVDLYSIDK